MFFSGLIDPSFIHFVPGCADETSVRLQWHNIHFVCAILIRQI
jgi:hypothetical protein